MKHSHIKHYKWRIRLLRFILPAAVVLLFLIGFIGPSVWWKADVLSIFTSNPPIHKVSNTMGKPDYYAYDAKGRPYTIKAQTAKQKSGTLVDLDKPKGVLQQTPHEKIMVDAKEGFLDQGANQLDLKRDVHVDHEGGYKLDSNKARINLDNHDIQGDEPVSGIGPDGLLKGEAFEVTDEGNRLKLKGKSQLILQTKGAKK